MTDNLTLHPDGRTTLHMQRRLPHPPEKVWRAITDPRHLAHWFPATVTIDGDHITYGFGPDGHITENDPPHVFAHTWGDDELRWEIRPDGATASILTLTHTFTDHHGAASFATGWHTCILALRATIGAPPPAPFTTPGLQTGAVTRIETAKLLEYDTPTGPVRWELTQGTGQGARLIVTHTGDTTTLSAWRVRVEELASSLVS
ncbi:SRPBCC domain-containing protein [Nonomuraea sp. NPDC049695]|uniref:SRPBCC domain-containing protein n=1 Tax=Nonomuraea sp. NPDC049695 TaxID=3154734 RepID=UPI00343784E5